MKKQDWIETPARIRKWPKLIDRFGDARIRIYSRQKALWWGEGSSATPHEGEAKEFITMRHAVMVADRSPVERQTELGLEFHVVRGATFECSVCGKTHALSEATKIFDASDGRIAPALLQIHLMISFRHAMAYVDAARAV